MDLNVKLGGWSLDYDLIPERYDADPTGLANIYRSGMNNTASNLDTTAIIDNRGPDPGAFHDSYRTYALRDRLIREHGTADNMLLWRGPTPLLGDATFTTQSVLAMDRWLAAVDADDSNVGLDDKIIRSRPEDVTDRCANGTGVDVDPAFCDAAIDVYSTPRIEAGAPLTDDVMRCQLQPLSEFDYGDTTLTAEQLEALAAVYPDGVCDYSEPGVGETDTVPWLDYSTTEGGVPMGPAPVSVPFGPDGEPISEPHEVEVRRVAGDNRVETAVEVSKTLFDTSRVVLIATASDFADALAGAPLAAQQGGPLLLSGRDGVPGQTVAEIERLGATRAILLGGEAALGPAVADQLAAMDLDVERIGGATREETSVLIAQRMGVNGEVVLAARGGFADALSVSALAASRRLPILLVQPDDLGVAGDVLTADTDVLVVGGTAVIGDAVAQAADDAAGDVTRLAGSNRYATSVAVAEAALARGLTTDTVWVATGRDFADGLVAGTAAGLVDGPLLLVDGANAAGSPEPLAFLTGHAEGTTTVNVAGGPAAVAPSVLDAIIAAVTTP